MLTEGVVYVRKIGVLMGRWVVHMIMNDRRADIGGCTCKMGILMMGLYIYVRWAS